MASKSKFLIYLIFLVIFGLTFPVSSLATQKFATVVMPVRGSDFWGQPNQTVLTMPQDFYKTLIEMGIPATWLLRFDTLSDPKITGFFEKQDKSHELGLFFEVTPKLTEGSKVGYPVGGLFWHDSNKVFLSGYSPEDRIKLIDEAFYIFKYDFGYYPAVVGAWHIDAFSAEYMARQYGVLAVLICADQASTDGYRIWGSFWGMPYYPSRYHILIPAQTIKNKVGVVVFQWAQRDPYFGYGGSVNESIYSLQINDYRSRFQGMAYFNHLLDVYLDKAEPFGQVTIGLENDYPWEVYKEGLTEELKEISKRKDVKFITAGKFAAWYMKEFPDLSPSMKIEGGNFPKLDQKALWQFSPQYRIGLVEKGEQKLIRDLRIYNENWPESNFLTANPGNNLVLEVPGKIDTVRSEKEARILDFPLNFLNLQRKFGFQNLPFKISNFLLLFYYAGLFFLILFVFRANILFIFLLIFGSIALSLPMIKSGLVYPFGMGFWGPNAHDGLWHIALINQLAKEKFSNPVFSGFDLKNYHLGFDFAAAALHKLTGIPPVNLYFQIIPPILAILIGWLTYEFVLRLTSKKQSAWWAVFFVYFSGSFGWIVTWLRSRDFGGESLFWANQTVSTLINPPYAFSLVLILSGLVLFLEYLAKYSRRKLILLSLIWGLLIQVKVYAGALVLGGLALLTIFLFVTRSPKTFRIGLLFLGSLLVSLVVFLPFNLKASSLLVFSPFWFPHTMLSFQDRFNWPRLEAARQVYFFTHQWWKWLPAEMVALAIFLAGNLGTRLIGLIPILSYRKRLKINETVFLLVGIAILGLLGSLLFIQKGNSWNSIQFFYYTQFVLSLFAGIFLGKLLEKKVFLAKLLLAILVLVLTLPTSLITLKNDYIPGRPPARVSFPELEALSFLRSEPDGIVLTYPFDQYKKAFLTLPKPVYAYETTGYVSALADKPTFLEDEMNLEISQYDWQPRKKEVIKFFESKDKDWGIEFVRRNKIKYIYLIEGQKMEFGEGDIGFEKIFDNSEVIIFQAIEG